MPAAPLIKQVVIRDSMGLHARTAAKFSKCAAQFNATVLVKKDEQTALADSILDLMMLMASCGTTLELQAEGPEALEVLEALNALVNNNFKE